VKIPSINFGKQLKHLERLVTDNSPAILTGLGVIGVGATAFLSHQAAQQANVVLESKKAAENAHRGAGEPRRESWSKAEAFSHTWKLYLPPVLCGITTSGCIIAANRISARRAAAIAGVLALTQENFSDYRDKVKEKMTGPQHEKMTSELAQDKANRVFSSAEPIIIGNGQQKCIELYTGQPFVSTREKIERAVNDINKRIIDHDSAALAEFYDFLDIPHNDMCDSFGWNTQNMMEIDIKAVLDKNGDPCLGVIYVSEPEFRPWQAGKFPGR
jgi:hypothetical protein